MGFINNYSDNFLRSNSPWGDDNVTVYNVPPKRALETAMQTQDLDYEQITDLITQFSEVMPSLDERDALKVGDKLKALTLEKEKRDNLEAITKEERDDAFEPEPIIVKEDVPAAKIKVETKPPVSTINLDFEDEILDLELQDLINQNNMSLQTAGIGGNDTDNFLIASFIVIAVILMTK